MNKDKNTSHNFSYNVKIAAFYRQKHLCAKCGCNLLEHMLDDNAHHVIPKQTGDRMANSSNVFIKSIDNCVILCLACHDVVHDSARFKDGPVAPASYFEYSHGKDHWEHLRWTTSIDFEWQRLLDH